MLRLKAAKSCIWIACNIWIYDGLMHMNFIGIYAVWIFSFIAFITAWSFLWENFKFLNFRSSYLTLMLRFRMRTQFFASFIFTTLSFSEKYKHKYKSYRSFQIFVILSVPESGKFSHVFRLSRWICSMVRSEDGQNPISLESLWNYSFMCWVICNRDNGRLDALKRSRNFAYLCKHNWEWRSQISNILFTTTSKSSS